MPPDLTTREAAAAPSSQTFMLIGTLVLLPVILAYTAFTYWLFRGKVAESAVSPIWILWRTLRLRANVHAEANALPPLRRFRWWSWR